MRGSLRALRARIDRLEARLAKSTAPKALTAEDFRLLTDDQVDAVHAAVKIKLDVRSRRSSEPRSPLRTEEDGTFIITDEEAELSDAELSKLSPDQRGALQVAEQIMRELKARVERS